MENVCIYDEKGWSLASGLKSSFLMLSELM